MAKEDTIKLEGTVAEVLPNATFRVIVPSTERPILCVINGRMRQNGIRVLQGDNVEIELSPYDLTRGRITRRK